MKHNSPTVNHHMVQWWPDSLQVNSSLIIALFVHSKNGLTKSDSSLLFCFVSCFNIPKLTKRFNILNASHSRAVSSMYQNFVNGFFQSLKHMFSGTFYCYHFVLLLLIQFFLMLPTFFLHQFFGFGECQNLFDQFQCVFSCFNSNWCFLTWVKLAITHFSAHPTISEML